jgi:hypothetical protein
MHSPTMMHRTARLPAMMAAPSADVSRGNFFAATAAPSLKFWQSLSPCKQLTRYFAPQNDFAMNANCFKRKLSVFAYASPLTVVMVRVSTNNSGKGEGFYG